MALFTLLHNILILCTFVLDTLNYFSSEWSNTTLQGDYWSNGGHANVWHHVFNCFLGIKGRRVHEDLCFRTMRLFCLLRRAASTIIIKSWSNFNYNMVISIRWEPFHNSFLRPRVNQGRFPFMPSINLRQMTLSNDLSNWITISNQLQILARSFDKIRT